MVTNMKNVFTILSYCGGFGLVIGGIVLSLVLSTIIDSSLLIAEKRIYKNEVISTVDDIFRLFNLISTKPSLANVLTLLEVDNPEDFQLLTSDELPVPGTRNVLTRRVPNNKTQTSVIEQELSLQYNTTIKLSYISDYPAFGDLFVVMYTSPHIPELIGIVVNSEEIRSNAINILLGTNTALGTKKSSFVEVIVLDTDTGRQTGRLGRIGLHPVFLKGQNETNSILVNIIDFIDFFGEITSRLIELYPITDVEIYIDDKKVFDINPVIDLDINESLVHVNDDIIVIVSDFPEPGYSTVFYLILSLGLFIVFIVTTIFVLLNNLRIKALRISEFKSRFIANISHEIRTPMNGILGMTELLSERYQDDTSRYYISTISSCGYTLMGIINDILDMSKIESGLVEIKQETVRVKSLVLNTISRLWTTYKMGLGVSRNELEIVLEIERGFPEKITSDSGRIRQVLSNLITNSLKFTDNGSIKVSISKKGSFAEFIVKDTGVGMTTDGLKKAFKPFIQVHSRVGMGGTGLGLPICKQLCSLMGGEIRCTSSVGIGTEVTFTIKLFNPTGESSLFRKVYTNDSINMGDTKETTSPSSVSDTLEPIKSMKPSTNFHVPEILIVDDIHVNRLLMSKMVETSLGVNIKTCDNGLQAVQLCEIEKFSIVLMDMVMPVMDGVESCRRIKANTLNKDTPIVFISANAQSSSIIECTEAGGDGFLSKPISKKDILELFIKHSSREEKEYVRRYIHDKV